MCFLFDLVFGEELWRIIFDEFFVMVRLIYDGKCLLVNIGFGKVKLISMWLDGVGDVMVIYIDWVVV